MILQSEDAARAFVVERCDGQALARLELFVARLKEANSRQNLVSEQSLASVWSRHIADSAQLINHVPRETALWTDLGTGAGFPGLVIAMMQPCRGMILVESRNLRAKWLSQIVEEMKLDNCRVLGTDVRQTPLMEADVISARAFAPLERLIALSARFSTAATYWVLPKGRSAAQEVAALPPAQRSLFHVKQSITAPDAGIVVGRGKLEAPT